MTFVYTHTISLHWICSLWCAVFPWKTVYITYISVSKDKNMVGVDGGGMRPQGTDYQKSLTAHGQSDEGQSFHKQSEGNADENGVPIGMYLTHSVSFFLIPYLS